MKPQREGGGTLLVGDAMCHALKTMPSAERASYILMDRIVPPECANYILRDGEAQLYSVLSELGVFGVSVDNAHHDRPNTTTPAGMHPPPPLFFLGGGGDASEQY